MAKKKRSSPVPDYGPELYEQALNEAQKAFENEMARRTQEANCQGIFPTGELRKVVVRTDRGGLNLSLLVTLSYRSVAGQRNLSVYHRTESVQKKKETALDELREALPKWITELMQKNLGAFPFPYNENALRSSIKEIRYQARRATALFKEDPTLQGCLDGIQQELLESASEIADQAARKAFEKRFSKAPKKAPGTKTSYDGCRISVAVQDNFTLDMVTTLSVTGDKHLEFTSNCTIDGLSDLFQQDPSLCVAAIKDRVMKAATTQGRAVAKKPPLYVILKSVALPDEYSTRGVFGEKWQGISGDWPELSSFLLHPPYTIASKDGVDYYMYQGELPTSKRKLPYIPATNAYNVDKAKRLPGNLHEFALFIDQGNQWFRELSGKEDTPIPAIHFTFDGKQITSACTKLTEIPLDTLWKDLDGETVKAHLKLVVKYLADQRRKKEEELEKQVSALNDLKLDPAAFAVLAFVVRKGRTWATEARTELKDALPDPSVDVRKYLCDLCKIEVTMNGLSKPLLCSQWANSRHGEFQLYTPGHEWQTAAFRLAKPADPNSTENDKTKSLEEEVNALNKLNLNPTEFAILDYLAKSGQAWTGKVEDALDGKVLTTKASTSHYLERLCGKYATLNGTTVCLLGNRWVDSKKGQFRLFFLNHLWHKESFQIAKPASFRDSDVAHMNAAGKRAYVENALNSAKTANERWKALSLLEKMPKTVAVEFARSKKGLEFFSAFEGDDATYAMFFLESLPGCKSRAKAILKTKEKEAQR